MTPFIQCFPQVGTLETRTLTAINVKGLPNGEYGFLEMYCDELHCDCRRVLIEVIARSTGDRLAVINYGWESEKFYEQDLGSREYAQEVRAASLDPMNRQSQYATALLDLFRQIVKDLAYVERLKRHYTLFKKTIQQAAR